MVLSSIIIPTAGRPVAIKTAIHSLLALTPEQFDAEIIVVDNNTSADLSADLFAFCGLLSGKVKYIREQSPGLTAARHRGAMEAKGNLLTFIDDDVEVSSSWLSTIQQGFADSDVGMVGGPSIPKFTCSIPVWFWDFIEPTAYGGWMSTWLSLLDIGQDVMDINPNYIFGLNFSIRKDVMLSCGGFHPDLVPKALQRWQGDGETGLTMKVNDSKYRAVYLRDAMLLHLCSADRLNVAYFQKRAFFQGVCDSYSQIRAGQQPAMSLQKEGSPSIISLLHSAARKGYRFMQGEDARWSREGAAVKQLTNKSYMDGWLFHQHEVAADAALLEWVQRKDYFETCISQ
jgi:glucosyl-dolichyl phosphate glucuronosyltransferase